MGIWVWICSRSGGLWRLEEWRLWTMGRSMEDLLSLSMLSTRIGYVFLCCCSLFLIAFVFIIQWNCMFWVKFYVAMIKGTNNNMPQQEKKSNGLRKLFVTRVWYISWLKKWEKKESIVECNIFSVLLIGLVQKLVILFDKVIMKCYIFFWQFTIFCDSFLLLPPPSYYYWYSNTPLGLSDTFCAGFLWKWCNQVIF